MMCRAKMLATILSACALVLGASTPARVLAAESSAVTRVFDALKEAGAYVLPETDEQEGQPKKADPDQMVTFIETDEAALKTLPVLWELPHPEKVTLILSNVKPHHAQELAAHAPLLATLKLVAITGDIETLFSDQDLCHLSKISALHNLNIGSATRPLPISDQGLECLKGHQGLRQLTLANAPITDQGLVHLKGLPKLEILMLFGTQINGEGLRHLDGLPLTLLLINGAPIDDRALKSIARLKNLERLILVHCPLEGRELGQLKNLPQLTRLTLSGTKIDDQALAHLEGLPQLKSLDVSGCNVSDQGIKHLKKLVGLEDLIIGETGITPEGVQELKQALPNVSIRKE